MENNQNKNNQNNNQNNIQNKNHNQNKNNQNNNQNKNNNNNNNFWLNLKKTAPKGAVFVLIFTEILEDKPLIAFLCPVNIPLTCEY